MFKLWKKPKNILEAFEAIAPDTMTGGDVVRLITSIVLTYAKDQDDAAQWTMLLAGMIRDYYTERNDGECTCDKCAARRKSEAH
jgi:hypothetical protein